MFARQPETNRFEQSRVQRGGLLGNDLSRRDLLRSVAQSAGWLSLPLVMNLQALPEHRLATKNCGTLVPYKVCGNCTWPQLA